MDLKKKTKFHVPGYMNLKKNILMYSSGVDRSKKIFLVLDKFFQHVKKILNFWNFVNIKVAPFKLDHLGFYCIYSFF